jgi:hypothetical protein
MVLIMANLTVQKVSLTGLNLNFTNASTSGDEFVNSGHTVLYVKNGGSTEKTITVDSRVPCNFGYDHDVFVIVPAQGERIIGPFLKEHFNDDYGKVHITYSTITGVTVAAVEVRL